MWIIKWCRKEEILHNFYAVLPESHKVDSKGLLVMFRPPVLFTTRYVCTTVQCLLKILKDDLSVHYPLMDPSRKSLMIYKRKSFPSFQKRRRSDHAKDIETGKILSIMSIKTFCCTRQQFNFMERFSELIKNLSDVPKLATIVYFPKKYSCQLVYQ